MGIKKEKNDGSNNKGKYMQISSWKIRFKYLKLK